MKENLQDQKKLIQKLQRESVQTPNGKFSSFINNNNTYGKGFKEDGIVFQNFF